MPHTAVWTPFVLHPRSTCTFSKHYHLNMTEQAKNTEYKCIFCEALTWTLIINNGKSQIFSNLLLNQQIHEYISYTHRHSHIHTQRCTHRHSNFILPFTISKWLSICKNHSPCWGTASFSSVACCFFSHSHSWKIKWLRKGRC